MARLFFLFSHIAGLSFLLKAQPLRDTTLSSLELNPVVIHAERFAALEPRRIQEVSLPSLTLGEALSSVAGVEWMQTGGAFVGRPVLRGHSYTRVLWLMGGLPREGAYWGEDHGYETPPQLLTYQPEILLGPQSVRYGSDAMGGVVRFQPLVPSHPFWKGYLHLHSNPLGGEVHLAGALGNPARFLMGEASFQSAENFYNRRQGHVWNTGQRAGYGYLTGRLPWRRGFVELSGFQTIQIVGIPSADWDAESRQWFSEAQHRYIPSAEGWRFQREPAFQRILSTGFQGRALWEGRRGATTALLIGGQSSERQEYGEDPTMPDVWLWTRRADVDLSHQTAGWEGGLTGFIRKTQDRGAEPFLPTVLHAEGGLWLRRAIPTRNARLILSGRLHQGWSQAQRSRLFLTWAAEAAYLRPPYTLRLSRSFRIPHPAELWAAGFHEGAKRYEYGNPNLPVEVAYTSELYLSLRKVEIRPFLQYFPTYIFPQRLPDTLPTVVGAAFTFSAQRALLAGSELEWQAQYLSVSLSYVSGRFIHPASPDERFIPRIPPLRLRLEGRYTLGSWILLPQVFVYAPQRQVYRLHQTEIPTPGYVLLHFTAKWRFLTFGVQNLLSTPYQPHLSGYRQWIPGGIDFPARNFFLQISAPT